MIKNRMRIFGFIASLLSIGTLFTACEPSEPNGNGGEAPKELGEGFYVMTEGLPSENNSALDFYSVEDGQTHLNLFALTNPLILGDTANDMIEVGEKLFIVVTGSNCVMVADKKTCKILAMILINQGENPQPRCIVHHDGSIFVSCFDGYVYKINASTHQIEKTALTQGRNPEAIAVCNGKLFVSNTGGLDFPNFDNSISVMNPDDLSLICKIEGLLNPGQIAVCGNKIIVQARGEFDDATYSYKDSELVRIDASSHAIEQKVNIVANAFTIIGDKVLYIESDSQMNNYYRTVPINNLQASPQTLIESNTANLPTSPYYIGSDSEYIYITDSKDYVSNGECFVFDHNGVLKYRFETSINPKKVIALQ